MFLTVLDVSISGLLMGGIYALIAMGLSIQYGVARVLNVSHGEFIMFGAFCTWWLHAVLGLNPFLAMIISGPVIFACGYGLHRTLFTSLRKSSENMGAYEGISLLASFGLMFIVQNVALLIWGADPQGYTFMAQPASIFGAIFTANRLMALVFAVTISLVFYLFLMHTRLGEAIRAAALNPDVAQLMGVNIHFVLALCFGCGAMLAGFAGSLISMIFEITPTMGMEYTIIAIIVVVLGGLGSITGSLIGGFILGLIGSIVTYVNPELSLIAYYIIFMLLILVKPTGILGK